MITSDTQTQPGNIKHCEGWIVSSLRRQLELQQGKYKKPKNVSNEKSRDKTQELFRSREALVWL